MRILPFNGGVSEVQITEYNPAQSSPETKKLRERIFFSSLALGTGPYLHLDKPGAKRGRKEGEKRATPRPQGQVNCFPSGMG